MGGTCACSNGNEFQHGDTHSRLRLIHRDDDEKEKEKANTAEIDAMAKEVILLSTRNANLQQELDELKHEMNHNLDVDVLRMCQMLKVKVTQIVSGEHDDHEHHQHDYDIARSIVHIDSDNKYLRTLKGTRYRHLFFLLTKLKASQQLEQMNGILVMSLYRLYYAEHGHKDDDDDEAAKRDAEELHVFCTQNFTKCRDTTMIDKIRKMVSDEMSVRAQCDALFSFSV